MSLASRVDALVPDLASKIWDLAARMYLNAIRRVAKRHVHQTQTYLKAFDKRAPICLAMYGERRALYMWRGVLGAAFEAQWPPRHFRKKLAQTKKRWNQRLVNAEERLEKLK
jgi:hypothetical protein